MKKINSKRMLALLTSFLLITSHSFGQKQISLTSGLSFNQNQEYSYIISSLGLRYRSKNLSYLASIDCFPNFGNGPYSFENKESRIFGGTIGVIKHHQTEQSPNSTPKLSGFYYGIQLSYIQFAIGEAPPFSYNFEPSTHPAWNIYSDHGEHLNWSRYRLLHLNTCLGYEYYPSKYFSTAIEISPGIAFYNLKHKVFEGTHLYDYQTVTTNSFTYSCFIKVGARINVCWEQ